MSNKFKDLMDSIQAEDDLKSRTKQYVMQSLSREQTASVNHERKFVMKKTVIAACAAVTLSAVALLGWSLYQTPVNYVSVDINPSVELGLNSFDMVVSAEATNEDGQTLIQNLDLTNKPVDEAVDALAQEAVEQDFVADDGSTVIAVTAESDDEDAAERLQEKSEQGVNLAMSNKKAIASVYKDASDLAFRKEARALGISPGKYKLIKMLQTLDPTIKVEDYIDAKVKDIIRKAADIIAANPDLLDQLKEAQDTDTTESSDAAESSDSSTDKTGTEVSRDKYENLKNAIDKIQKAEEKAKQAKEKAKQKREEATQTGNTAATGDSTSLTRTTKSTVSSDQTGTAETSRSKLTTSTGKTRNTEESRATLRSKETKTQRTYATTAQTNPTETGSDE